MLEKLRGEIRSIFNTIADNAVSSFFPFRSWTLTYTRDIFRRDLVAGLTVAGIIIPQAMAQTLLVGIPPVYGLYALLVASFVGALWGSSPYVITAPVAVVSLLTLSALAPHAEVGSPEYIALAVILALLVGIIQLGAGFLRLGFLSRLVPHSVLIGFSVSAGIVIALFQVPNLLGFSLSQDPFVIETLHHLFFMLVSAHPLTAAIGISTFLAVYLIRKLRPNIPVSLIVLALSIPVSILLDLRSLGVPLVGDVPRGIPLFFLPELSLPAVINILGAAFVIALVGFMETYAIGKSLGKKHGERVSADQELVGQGAANVATSFVGGYPVSGSFSASAVNDANGARTPVAGMVVSAATLITLLFFTYFLAYLPKTILAAVVIASVLQLVRFEQIRHMFAISRSDGFLALATFAIALIVKPDSAIMAGIILAIVLFIYRVMWPRVEEMGFDEEYGVLRPVEEGGERIPHTLIVRPHMSFQYVNAEHIVILMRRLLDDSRDVKHFVIHFASVNHIDLTGVEEIGEFLQELRAKGIAVYGLGIKGPQKETLERAEREIGHIHFFASARELHRTLAEAPTTHASALI